MRFDNVIHMLMISSQFMLFRAVFRHTISQTRKKCVRQTLCCKFIMVTYLVIQFQGLLATNMVVCENWHLENNVG